MNDNLKHIEKAMKHIKAIKPENDTDEKYIRQLKTMLHNMRMKMEAKLREEIENLPELPDDAICTREVNNHWFNGKKCPVCESILGDVEDGNINAVYCDNRDCWFCFQYPAYATKEDAEKEYDKVCTQVGITREVKHDPFQEELKKYNAEQKHILKNGWNYGMLPKGLLKIESQGRCDDFKLSDKEFNEIADAMEQVGKNIEKEKQLNDKETKMLEEQFASDEYIEQLRQKQQTDCKKCIYQISKLGNLPNEENNVGFIKGKRNATMGYGIKVCCQFDLRESRPICPLFDDGKEVKQ